MKAIHKIGITVFAIGSLGLFSFTKAQAATKNYQVITNVNSKMLKVAGFDRYQESKYLPDQTTWNYRCQSWSLINNGGDVANLETVLKK